VKVVCVRSGKKCGGNHLWPCWLAHLQVFEEGALGRHVRVSNWLI
jgi:hypothetical protein